MELWMSIMAACPGCKGGFDAATARGFSYSNLQKQSKELPG